MDFADWIEDAIIKKEGFFVDFVPCDDVEIFLGEEEIDSCVSTGDCFGAVKSYVGFGFIDGNSLVATDCDVGASMIDA